jgi:hypothetical protein
MLAEAFSDVPESSSEHITLSRESEERHFSCEHGGGDVILEGFHPNDGTGHSIHYGSSGTYLPVKE